LAGAFLAAGFFAAAFLAGAFFAAFFAVAMQFPFNEAVQERVAIQHSSRYGAYFPRENA
jgi:HAMP domain-containing protein